MPERILMERFLTSLSFAFTMRFWIAFLCFWSHPLYAQPKHKAKVEEQLLYQLDVARPVVWLDAVPDGSNWLVVDKFGLWQSIIVNGVRYPKEFHEIPFWTARLSPNGKYAVWSGLMHAVNEGGYDSTQTLVFRDSTLIGSYIADYSTLLFSPTGNHWGMLLPQ